MKKTVWLYPVVFASTVLVCLLFLMGAALVVPQEAIRENAVQSARYFTEVPLFENSVGELENFKKDNYADCITTGIAWNMGEGKLYEAVISADYAHENGENVNISFEREMQDLDVNTESYARYWHGSAAVVRFFLLLADIETVRYIIAAIGFVFNTMFVFALIRKEQKVLALFYTIAFLAVNGLFALTCLEYTFVLGMVPVASIFLLHGKCNRKITGVFLAFMVIGMLTAFFDFLTAETLTFTVPFVMYYLVIWKRPEDKNKKKKGLFHKKDWSFFLKSGICWCAGYVGMFLAKWGLATIVLGKDAFLTSMDSAMERIGGEVSITLNMADEKANLGQRIQGIFQRNLGCLYWGDREMTTQTVIIITLVLAAILGCFWYMTRKEKCNYDKAAVLTMVSLVPVIRFLGISNHAYIHYFFTYRALLVTVMVILYLIYKTTVLSVEKGESRRKEYGRKN